MTVYSQGTSLGALGILMATAQKSLYRNCSAAIQSVQIFACGYGTRKTSYYTVLSKVRDTISCSSFFMG